MQDEELIFDMFWEASSLDRFNIRQFATRISNYDSDQRSLQLQFSRAATLLPNPKTKLNKIAKSRKSQRTFSPDPLSYKELGKLFSSFYAWNGLDHRSYPSAGATYTTEIFCAAFNTKPYKGKLLYYDAEKHGLVILAGLAPSWKEARKSLNIETSGTPQLLIIFVIFPERSMNKYGERGGRFALIETGAAMQQLSLQIANTPKLKGVAVGGMLDRVWLKILGLDDTSACIALGYLVGK